MEKYSDSVKNGKVIEVEPASGTDNYDVNMPVKIYVSNTPESSAPESKPSESHTSKVTSKADDDATSESTETVDPDNE